VTKTQQSEDPEGGRIHTSTPHWCTLGAALEELGWPWGRLHGELVAGRLSYRTWPPGHEIDWGDPALRVDLDRVKSTVTFVEMWPPGATAGMGWDETIVAVEVLLPVGQRPSAALIKASWRDRMPPEADLENAMKEIAQSYDGKPPPTFNDIWSELKNRWPDFPRDPAREALATYAPQLKRAPGDRSKIKSRS
jgi:hypothetical protein